MMMNPYKEMQTLTPLEQSTFGRVLQKGKQLISPFTDLTKTQKNIPIEKPHPLNQTLVQTYKAFINQYLMTLEDVLYT